MKSTAATPAPAAATNTVSLPALRDGNFAVVSATLLARHDRDWRPLGFIPKSGYDSAEAANAMGLAQLAYYRALERTRPGSHPDRLAGGRAPMSANGQAYLTIHPT